MDNLPLLIPYPPALYARPNGRGINHRTQVQQEQLETLERAIAAYVEHHMQQPLDSPHSKEEEDPSSLSLNMDNYRGIRTRPW